MTDKTPEEPTGPVEVRIDNQTVQILQTVEEWHANASEHLMTLVDNGKAGVTLDLGPDLKILLTEEMASGFRTGLLVAKSLFGKLPFDLTPPEEQEVQDAEVAK